MVISVISVSSDSLKESVGTSAGRVILFGIIPTTISDTTPTVTSPTTHVDTTLIPTEIPTVSPIVSPSLDYTPTSPDYSTASDTEPEPFKDPSSDHIPPLPATSPFLSSTDDSSDSDTPDTPPSPTHEIPPIEITLLPKIHREISPAISSSKTSSDSSLKCPIVILHLVHSSQDHVSTSTTNRSFESSVPRETCLRDDVDVRGSDELYSEPDMDPKRLAKERKEGAIRLWNARGIARSTRLLSCKIVPMIVLGLT
ncbi:hypothetical protein Tco_0604327 [Tanacetum coccineum]